MAMKVALLKRKLSKMGGLEKQLKLIATAFYEDGSDVTLITDDASKDYRCKSFTSFDAHALKNYDIVLGIDRAPFQTHIRAGNGVHKAYLTKRARYLSLLPKHRKTIALEKQSLASPHLRHIITNSEMVKREYIKHYNVPKEKITAIHNGVEWDAFEKPFESKTPHNHYRYLFVGSDFKRKGLLPLLHAFSHTQDAELYIVGTDKRQKSYQTLAKGLGIDKRVHFFGETNPLPYYQKCDCLVLPTLYDPFANVTLEALSLGLFVITTPFNGGSEILSPQTGTIIQNNKELQTALQNALATSHDPAFCRASIKHLDIKNQLKKFIEVCKTT